MFLEDGHGGRQVVLDNPLDECLVGAVLPAIVGDCVFQGLASVCRSGFGHLDGSVVQVVWYVQQQLRSSACR